MDLFKAIDPTKSGVTVFRVNKFEPELVPEKLHDCSTDEKGAVAALASQLDTQLNDAAIQFREEQSSESTEFMKIWKSAVRYKKGGYDSGFSHKETNEATREKKLYHIQSVARAVRVVEVPVKYQSLNSGDSFVLDNIKHLFVWHGESASIAEKGKAMQVASEFRANCGVNAPDIIPLQQGDISSKDAKEFFHTLGVKMLSVLKINKPIANPTIPKPTLEEVAIGKLQGPGTKVDISRKALDDSKVFKLVAGRMYIWAGKQVSLEDKKAVSEELAKIKHKEGVLLVKSGLEPIDFQTAFPDWFSADVSYVTEQAKAAVPETAEDREKAIQVEVAKMMKSSVGFLHFTCTGEAKTRSKWSDKVTVKVWRVENMKQVEVPQEKIGQFFSGDSYIVLASDQVSKSGPAVQVVYFWQGSASSKDEVASSAIMAVNMDNQLDGNATQVRVTQGKEPSHFLELFGSEIVIHSGGVASGFKNIQDEDTIDENGLYLYQIRDIGNNQTYITQVDAKATSLDSSDCFVLINKSNVWYWTGKYALDSEKEAVTKATEKVLGSNKELPDQTTLAEGEETEEFWSLLGGQQPYAAFTRPPPTQPPRLFLVSDVTAGGKNLRVEALPSFAQSDLDPSDVSIVDTYSEVYVWIGAQASETEITQAPALAQQFVKQQGAVDGRAADTPVVVVKQGHEPPMFKAQFVTWQDWSESDMQNSYQQQLDSLPARTQQSGVTDNEPSETATKPVEAATKPAEAAAKSAEVETKPTDGGQLTPEVATNGTEGEEAKVAAVGEVEVGSGEAAASMIKRYNDDVQGDTNIPSWYTQKANEEDRIVSSAVKGVYDGTNEYEMKYVLGKDFIAYEELKGMKASDGIDMTQRQNYLSDEEFKTVLGQTKEQFSALAKWKQTQLKKETGLF